MPSWKGQTKGGKFGYAFFIFLLKNFPLSVPYFFSGIIAVYYFLFIPKSSKAVFFYFHKIIGYSKVKSIFSVYKNYHIFGKILIDKSISLTGRRGLFEFKYDGEEYFRTVLAENKGGIFLSGHIGNWEMAMNLLDRLEGKINLLILDAEHQQIKKMLSDITVLNPVNIHYIPIRNDFSHLFELKTVFKNGEIVCIHGDRYLTDSKTVKVDFMGYPALFSTGPFVLALRFNVPVSYFFTMKEKGMKYHYYAFPAEKPPEFLPDNEKVIFMLNDYLRVLEKFIRKYPEQWFNYYNFWEISQ